MFLEYLWAGSKYQGRNILKHAAKKRRFVLYIDLYNTASKSKCIVYNVHTIVRMGNVKRNSTMHDTSKPHKSFKILKYRTNILHAGNHSTSRSVRIVASIPNPCCHWSYHCCCLRYLCSHCHHHHHHHHFFDTNICYNIKRNGNDNNLG